MPFRSYSTWTWWFRSPSGCTHQHHGKTHLLPFHSIPRLTFGLWLTCIDTQSFVWSTYSRQSYFLAISGLEPLSFPTLLQYFASCSEDNWGQWSHHSWGGDSPLAYPPHPLQSWILARTWEIWPRKVLSSSILPPCSLMRLHPSWSFPSLPAFLIQVHPWGEGKASCSIPHPLWLGSSQLHWNEVRPHGGKDGSHWDPQEVFICAGTWNRGWFSSPLKAIGWFSAQHSHGGVFCATCTASNDSCDEGLRMRLAIACSEGPGNQAIDDFPGAWLHFLRTRVQVCIRCNCVQNTG